MINSNLWAEERIYDANLNHFIRTNAVWQNWLYPCQIIWSLSLLTVENSVCPESLPQSIAISAFFDAFITFLKWSTCENTFLCTPDYSMKWNLEATILEGTIGANKYKSYVIQNCWWQWWIRGFGLIWQLESKGKLSNSCMSLKQL